MLKLWKQRRALQIVDTQLAIKEREASINALDHVLEARNQVVDTDLRDGWTILGTGEGLPTEQEHKTMQLNAYKMYHTNTHARAIVRNLVKFVLGKGPAIIPDDEKNKKVKEVWKSFRKLNKMNRREKEIATRLFRDGETFLRLFINKLNGEVKIRFIRSSRIGIPNNKKIDEKEWSFGIKCDPDDIEDVKAYYLLNPDGSSKNIVKASDIIHLKIFADSDQKRGVSVLRIAAKRIRQYDDWLEDRIVLNKVRSAIALIRKVDSSASKVTSIRDDGLSTQLSSTRLKQKMPHRGTIITASKGVEYDMLSPRIQAGDVKDDGRSMLLSVASAVGFPEMIFTADYANANYASSLVAQNPFVREIEDWQDFLLDFYEELFEIVIQASIDYGELDKETETTCRVEFPPMIQADLEKIAKAFEILFKYKGISKKTWQNKMGLDPDVEAAQIEQEPDMMMPAPMPGQPGAGQAKPGSTPPGQPGAKSPFNMPLSPVNQFGAEIMHCIKEGNWDRLIEISEELEENDAYEAVYENHSNNGKEKFGEWIKDILEVVLSNQPDINVNISPAEVNITQPDINITTPDINITTPDVKPHIVVEATQVNVEQPNIIVNTPDVKVEPVINVATPDVKVNVESQDITIEPTNLQVDVHVPERKAMKKKVERDSDGNITGITESI
jgi:hypothetical protein